MARPQLIVAEKAFDDLLILLQNLFAGLSEYMREKEAEEFKAAMHELALADPEKNPLDEKIYAIVNSVWSSTQIPIEEKEKIVSKLNEFAETRGKIPARAGLNKLRRLFKNSGLSESDKATLNKMIKAAEYSMDDPMSIKVDRSMYNAMKRIINDPEISNVLQGNFTAMPCASGDYLFMFNRSVRPIMSNIAIAAGRSLGIIDRPTQEDIKAQAYAQSGDGTPAILVFKDVPAETAERAVVESGHVGMVTFSKTLQQDGRYTLTCLAGNDEDERRECLTRAKNILAYSAYMTTGMAGIVGKAQARHTANEYNKIEKVLESISDPEIQEEDEGYIYSIHTIEQPNGGRFTLANDFVEFDRESFTCHYMGAIGKTVSVREDPKAFLFNLESNIKSGSGQKVYISKTQMKDMENRAEGLLIKVSKMDDKFSQDAMGKLTEKINSLSAQMDAAENDVVRAGIKNEINDIQILFDVFSMYHCPPAQVTFDMIKDRMVAHELESHVFRFKTGYEAKKLGMTEEEVNKIIDAERSMASYSYRNNESLCTSGLTVVGKPSIAFHTEDLNGIGMFNINKYIAHESIEGAITDRDLQTGRKSQEQISEEEKMLEKYHSGHIEEMRKVLSQISVQMDTIDIDKEIDTSYTKQAKKEIDYCIKEIKKEIGKASSKTDELDIKPREQESIQKQSSREVR